MQSSRVDILAGPAGLFRIMWGEGTDSVVCQGVSQQTGASPWRIARTG